MHASLSTLSKSLSLSALITLAACAQNPDPATPSAPPPPASTDRSAMLITGAHVFDGERDLGIVSLRIRDGMIEAIGADLPADSGDEQIDYSGRFIMPGLINNHAHLGNTDGIEHGDRFYTREHVIRDLRQFQAFGITTVTSLGMNGKPFYTLRAEVNANPALGAYLLGSAGGIGVPEGAPPAAAMGLVHDPVARPATAEAAREAVRQQAALGVDIVKLWVDDLGGNAPQMLPDIYRAAIEESHAQGLRVAAHIHDLHPAADLVASGIDVIAHGVRDQALDNTMIEAMKAKGTWYVATVQIDEANYLYAEQPELIEQEPALRAALSPALKARFEDAQWRAQHLASPVIAKSHRAVETNLANLRALHAAGARIGFGTDAGALPHRIIGFAEHRELELMTQAGFTSQAALTTATRDAAELAQLDDRGLLRPGRRADFIVLTANPLDDIRNTRSIQAVWQGGQRVAGTLEDFAHPSSD